MDGTHPLDYLQFSFPKGLHFFSVIHYHVFDRCHVQNSAVSILTDWESAQKGYSYFSLNAKTYSRKLSSDKELKALSLPRVRNWKSFRFENVITIVYWKMSIFWTRVKGGANPIMRRLPPASQNIITHNRKNRIEICSNYKELQNFEFNVLIGG